MKYYRVARADIHMWEEPVISGRKGSGTIFFSGCSLKCVFCQNYEISHFAKGLSVGEEELCRLMLRLQDAGAHNINLVTPSHYARQLATTLERVRPKLTVPVVYNSSGYEDMTALRSLEGLIDIYLPDLKFSDSVLAARYCRAGDYAERARAAIAEMRRQQPRDIIENGIMKRGVIVRHLALPGYKEDSKKALDFLAELDKTLYVSLMSQYFPTEKAAAFPELNKKVAAADYKELLRYFRQIGLTNGFLQSPSSAVEAYVPSFELTPLEEVLSRLD